LQELNQRFVPRKQLAQYSCYRVLHELDRALA
jgi:hypothetical protein